LDFPHETESHRRDHYEAMQKVPAVYAEVQDEFERIFGRRPADRVVPYRMDDADIVLVSMGTTASTSRVVVDAAREQGLKVGSLRVRMFRPFPEDLLREHLSGRQRIAIMDRDVCPGLGGVLWGEVRGVVPDALMQGYMVGVGGGDVQPKHIQEVLDDLIALDAPGTPKIMEVA